MTDKKAIKIEQIMKKRITKALENAEIPRIHFNGFINTTGAGDVMIVLESNGQPVAIVNGSFTVVKTLAQKLQTLIINLEKKSGNTIMTTDEVDKVFSGGAKSDQH